MRKLALSDEVLLSVEKPARYIGGEINMVKKDPCHILGFKYYMICLIRERIYTASVSIHHGWIWIRSCGSKRSRCLH